MSPAEQCQHCRFYVEEHKECRRFPPVIRVYEEKRSTGDGDYVDVVFHDSVFPNVALTWGCGEFKSKYATHE